MTGKPKTLAVTPAAAIAAALLSGMTGPAWAQSPDPPMDSQSMQSQIDQLKSELARMKQQRKQQDQSWMDPRRTEPIKQTGRDVLDDADTRDSLAEDSVQAGISDEGGIFLRSADDRYTLELGGHVQGRYIYNSREDTDHGAAIDDDVAGFQLRRIKLKGEGHIADPKLGYEFSLAGDRDGATAFFEDYLINYRFDNGLMIQAGRWKQPFARENLTSSSRQLAVERSLVLETFNVDRSEGLAVFWSGDRVKLGLSFNDGLDGENTDFDTNTTDFAFTSRADVKLAGEWDQMKDYSAWSGEPFAAFLGVAGHYQQGESDSANNGANIFLATVDGSIETQGLGLSAAGYFSRYDNTADGDLNNFGLELQGAYNINDTFEPFARYELIALDDNITGLVDDTINVATVGLNWYQRKHNAKFTLDLVYVADSIGGPTAEAGLDPSTGLGLLDDDGGDGQVALRAQYQIKF